MFANAYYWKNELLDLANDMRRYAPLEPSAEKDAPDVSYSEYRLERSLILSAFIIRSLFESEKLTNGLDSFSLKVQCFNATDKNTDRVIPLLRKYIDVEYYDFSSYENQAVNGRRFANQLIHSFVVVSYEIDDTGEARAFYVVSDRDSKKTLYRCAIDEWLKFVKRVAEDEITESSTSYDLEKKRWVSARR